MQKQKMANQYQNQHKDLQRKGEEAIHNLKNFLQQNSLSTPKFLAITTILPLGALLLFLGGLSFMASLIGLVIATPVFLLLSPITVPTVFSIGFAVLGFFLSGAFGIMGLSALSWIVNFIRYRAGGVENIMQRAKETVGDMGQKVRVMGQDVTGEAQDATRT